MIAFIVGTVNTSGRTSDKMAPIRSSPASFLPELTLVHILAHKDMNCMKPLYRLGGMSKCLRYSSVSWMWSMAPAWLPSWDSGCPSSGWLGLCPEEQAELLKYLPATPYLPDTRFKPPKVPLARIGFLNVLDKGTLPAPVDGSRAREFTFRFHPSFHPVLSSRVPPELGFQEGGGQWNWRMTLVLPQLYELDADPKRKEFLDDLFSFMQKRGE